MEIDKKKKRRKINPTIVFVGLSIVLLCAAIFIIWISTVKSKNAAKKAYLATEKNVEEETYNRVYDNFIEIAENQYHVENSVDIEIVSVEEQANLEVIKVAVTVPVVSDEGGYKYWMKATGSGTYTVDLKQAEYLIDKYRRYVIVRIPKPKLTDYALIDTEQVLCKNTNWILDGSISEGEEIKDKANKKATVKIKEALSSNEMYMENAQSSAVTLISNLVKNLNPNILDLNVEVEFME